MRLWRILQLRAAQEAPKKKVEALGAWLHELGLQHAEAALQKQQAASIYRRFQAAKAASSSKKTSSKKVMDCLPEESQKVAAPLLKTLLGDLKSIHAI